MTGPRTGKTAIGINLNAGEGNQDHRARRRGILGRAPRKRRSLRQAGQSAGGEALRGERWVGPALPALIGRAEDFEVDPKSSMKRLRSFKQKQTVIGFP